MISLVVAVISFGVGTIVMAAVIALMKSGTRKDLENEISYLKADIISLKDENANVKEQRDKFRDESIGKVTAAYDEGFRKGKLSLIKEIIKKMELDHDQNVRNMEDKQ